MEQTIKCTINAGRLWRHIEELGRIGRNADGSITRFPFTEEDLAAQTLISRYMEEAGLSVETDAAGNLIGRWTDPGCKNNPPVLTGSHYDTVLNGGRFDGTLGVLGAIEAVQTMKEAGIRPAYPICVIGFKDEEGNRFGYGMIGSKSICGIVSEEGLDSEYQDGFSLRHAMTAYGLQPEQVQTCRIAPVKAMLELHIEQGKVLEKHQKQIGIVDGIAGLVRYRIVIHGESGHAGATPMTERKDPVVAMSKWILKVTQLAKEKPFCVATVGSIQTFPGTCNIIADRVEFTLDLRSIHEQDICEIMQTMETENEWLEQTEGVCVSQHLEQRLSPVLCDMKLKEQLQKICETGEYSYMYLMSGAGHDSMNFKDVCPLGMIFVPSEGGYSHRKEEFTGKADCAAGAQVLMEVLIQQSCT